MQREKREIMESELVLIPPRCKGPSTLVLRCHYAEAAVCRRAQRRFNAKVGRAKSAQGEGRR